MQVWNFTDIFTYGAWSSSTVLMHVAAYMHELVMHIAIMCVFVFIPALVYILQKCTNVSRAHIQMKCICSA